MVRRCWAINGRFLAQPLTGVQRYAFEIVRQLDELVAAGSGLTTDLDLELVLPPDAQAPRLAAIRTRRVGPLSGHAWEQTVLPLCLRGGLLSLCNTGPLAIGKQILCIHDVNTLSHPQSYSLPFRLVYRALLPALGGRAARLATVSRYSAGELVRWRVAAADKITVIPNGHEHAARWQPRHSATTLAASGRNTIVVVGSKAPHKNMQLIVAMADRLAEAGLRVALVGSTDARVFRPPGAQEAGNILPLGRLCDEEMAALLQDCLCLAFPSLVEGFGLPPLEAMATGCPVVASPRASLPEICGDAALYASPHDPQAWLACFDRLRLEPGLRETLIARGKRQAATFCWLASARRYLHIMALLDALPAGEGRDIAPQITA